MLCFVFAALVVLLDQFIKRWVLLTLPLHESAPLIPGIIGLTHVQNPGAAFGILPNQRWLLTAIAFLCALMLIALLLRYDEGFWGMLGLSSVLGGAIGNLVDRLAYGHVIDIFDFQFANFAIFNIADVFIVLGCLTVIIYIIISTFSPPAKQPVSVAAPVEERSSERVIAEPPPQVKDEIGLYDFEYGEKSRQEDNLTQDEQNSGGISESRYSKSAYLTSADSSSDSADDEFPSDIANALDVLSELEKELADMEIDKDIDDLLREYGFEDDDTEF
ncbi:MAG: signal peptidase II [Oscillospiraceae bacterium]|nr:signal peptidase II [Oscillospiraceae bacterium]